LLVIAIAVGGAIRFTHFRTMHACGVKSVRRDRRSKRRQRSLQRTALSTCMPGWRGPPHLRHEAMGLSRREPAAVADAFCST
jgi:hypothetical protein